MPLSNASRHRLRLYAAALEQARRFEDANDAARWLIRHGLLAVNAHPALPTAYRPPLVAATQRNAAANLLRVRRFQDVVVALDGLAVAPLKGLHMLATVYRDDPEHRVLTDLDLLVRRAELATALDRLDRLGYRETAASRRVAAHRHERVLSDGTLTVELHTHLGMNHGAASAWDDLSPAPGRIHDRPCHLLDTETTLVHLVTHFVRHGPFTRLGWVEDILRWCEGEVDGARAAAIAGRLGAQRSFAAGVRALSALVGDDLLPSVPRRGEDRRLAWHQRLVWHGLDREPLVCGFASNGLRRNLSAVWLADRPGDAWAFLVSKGQELRHRWWPGGG